MRREGVATGIIKQRRSFSIARTNMFASISILCCQSLSFSPSPERLFSLSRSLTFVYSRLVFPLVRMISLAHSPSFSPSRPVIQLHSVVYNSFAISLFALLFAVACATASINSATTVAELTHNLAFIPTQLGITITISYITVIDIIIFF